MIAVLYQFLLINEIKREEKDNEQRSVYIVEE